MSTTAWTVSVQQPFGDHKVWITYGTAGAGSAPTDRRRSMPGPNRLGLSGCPGPKS